MSYILHFSVFFSLKRALDLDRLIFFSLGIPAGVNSVKNVEVRHDEDQLHHNLFFEFEKKRQQSLM